jgi:hypothetical protein
MKTFRWLGLVMAVFVVCAGPAQAQVRGMGRIVGVIVDDGGASVDGATLRTATASGDVIETTSDAKGRWLLVGIGRGDWQLTVLKPGFVAKRLRLTVERELERSQEIKITMTKAGS